MKITSSVHQDVAVIGVVGELIAGSVATFRKAVDEATSAGHRDYVINLAETGTIDSAGLEALTALQRQCEEQLGTVRLCGGDETICKILEMTRLDRQLSMHQSLEEALDAFSPA